MIKLLVDRLNTMSGGKRGIFLDFFELLDGFGMTPFAIVAKAVEVALPQLEQLTMLHREIKLMDEAMEKLFSMTGPNEKYIGFYKAMYQERFVPVDPNAVKNLVAVCAIFAGAYEKSYRDYDGGDAPRGLLRRARDLLKEMDVPEDEPEEEEEVIGEAAEVVPPVV
jgi:hypothetical protein